MKNTSLKKIMLWFLLMIIVLGIFFVMVVRHKETIKVVENGVVLIQPQAIHDFWLVDNAGQPFTKPSLKGHWTFLFFGFTRCNGVCPTTMAALNKMYGILAETLPAEKMPQVVMVTVDPERDSVEKMNTFVTSFNPHFIGVRAGGTQIQDLVEEFHLVAEKMPSTTQDKKNYIVNHSAEIIVLNPEGKLQAVFSAPHEPLRMASAYQALLKTSTL